jgi:GxxExxY protein
MPIHIGADIRRMDDREFAATVYEVMRHVFDVHRELGRLFNERIYQREIGFRIPDAQREVPVQVQFEDFCKLYYLDLLVRGGALFELKAVELLADRHERQLLHYLFLADLPHGKLANLRGESVIHRFVNNTLTLGERMSFAVIDDGWDELLPLRLKDRSIAMLRDWGTGLGLELYEEAAMYLCGQPLDSEAKIEIHLGNRSLGRQRMRIAGPYVGLEITALNPERREKHEAQLGHLLAHADLQAIQWINITRFEVRYKTLQKRK